MSAPASATYGRPAGRLRPIAIGAAVVFGEALLGAALVEPRLARLLLPLFAAVAVAVAFRFPFFMTCLVLVLIVSLFHRSFFSLPFGSLQVRPHELALALLLLVALVRPRRRTWGGTAGLALGFFLAVLTLSTVLAVLGGHVDFAQAYNWLRSFFVFTLFYAIVRLFPDPVSSRRLLMVGVALGAFAGVVALVAALGSGIGSVLQDPAAQTVRSETGLPGFLRVRLPGLALAYGLFTWALVELWQAEPRRRLLWLAAVFWMTVNIAVSLNRNMWIGLIFAFALILAIGGARVRYRIFRGVAIGAAAVLLLVLIGPEVQQGSKLYPLVQRGLTLRSASAVSEDESLAHRGEENRKALASIRQHLAIGVGVGTPFGITVGERRSAVSVVRVPQRFLHNQYVYILLAGGIPALVAFLVFLVAVLSAAWRAPPGGPPLVACGVGLAGIALSGLVMLSFTSENMIAAIALLAGIVVSVRSYITPSRT